MLGFPTNAYGNLHVDHFSFSASPFSPTLHGDGSKTAPFSLSTKTHCWPARRSPTSLPLLPSRQAVGYLYDYEKGFLIPLSLLTPAVSAYTVWCGLYLLPVLLAVDTCLSW